MKRTLHALFLVCAFGLTIAAQESVSVHVTLGNPSDASDDTTNKDNFLMVKPQFVLSYNNSKGGPNWASWLLVARDIGTVSRGDFHPDTSLPAGFVRITKANYNNTGFDRGHVVNSKDRTRNRTNNNATFNMTNILPQAPDNNQGPWVKLENFERELAQDGNEVYIVAGAFGQGGTGRNGRKTTIANGKVNVPKVFWKMIVVVPNGSGDDLARIDNNTRVIAVCMINKQGIRNDPWQKYVTTVNNIETATGYDLLSELSSSLQTALQKKRDSEGTGTGNPCQ